MLLSSRDKLFIVADFIVIFWEFSLTAAMIQLETDDERRWLVGLMKMPAQRSRAYVYVCHVAYICQIGKKYINVLMRQFLLFSGFVCSFPCRCAFLCDSGPDPFVCTQNYYIWIIHFGLLFVRSVWQYRRVTHEAPIELFDDMLYAKYVFRP